MIAAIHMSTVLSVASSSEVSLVLKVTLMTVLALLGVGLARGMRAAVRAAMLASLFGALLVLPPAATAFPPLSVEIATPAEPETMVLSSAPNDAVPVALGDAAVAVNQPVGQRRSWPSRMMILRAVWVMGIAAVVIPMLVALWNVRRLRRDAHPWPAGQVALDALATANGVGRSIQLVRHRELPAPMTYGVLHPVIVMPADADQWGADDLRQSLVHELEHICRGDWPVQIVARLVCALYWFHPLVWIAWSRLRLESERACDDAVLGAADRTAYADQLVTLARRLSQKAPQPVVSMASRSDLSARISALLDHGQPRGRAGMFATATLISTAALLVVCISPLRAVGRPSGEVTPVLASLATPTLQLASSLPVTLARADLAGGSSPAPSSRAAIPVPAGAGVERVGPSPRSDVRRAFAQTTLPGGPEGDSSLSGALLDTFGRALADRPMELKSTAPVLTYQTRSDANGHFVFGSVRPGDYEVDVNVPGFTTRYRIVIRAGQRLERDVTLQVGTIEETVMVTKDSRPSSRTPPPVVDLPTYHPETSRCAQASSAGCIEPPVRVAHVQPQYPAGRSEAERTVIHLEGRIGTDGFLSSLRVLAPAEPDFASSALEAVKGWQFRPTRLDGVPVETSMKVTIAFGE